MTPRRTFEIVVVVVGLVALFGTFAFVAYGLYLFGARG